MSKNNTSEDTSGEYSDRSSVNRSSDYSISEQSSENNTSEDTSSEYSDSSSANRSTDDETSEEFDEYSASENSSDYSDHSSTCTSKSTSASTSESEPKSLGSHNIKPSKFKDFLKKNPDLLNESLVTQLSAFSNHLRQNTKTINKDTSSANDSTSERRSSDDSDYGSMSESESEQDNNIKPSDLKNFLNNNPNLSAKSLTDQLSYFFDSLQESANDTSSYNTSSDDCSTDSISISLYYNTDSNNSSSDDSINEENLALLKILPYFTLLLGIS